MEIKREIKFRFWDAEKELMYRSSKDFDPNGESDLAIDMEGLVLEVCYRSYDSSPQIKDGLEIMQYTGLKDRNGKEIYEGDILDFGGLKPIEIVWRDCGFKSKLIPYENSEPIHLNQEGLSAFAEIIGNIYENPDLLPLDKLSIGGV